MTTIIRFARTSAARTLALVALAFAGFAPAAEAETLLMPKRDALAGTPVVIWGVTTKANGTPININFGDPAIAPVSTTVNAIGVGERSYIHFTRTYTTPGVKTVTLTVMGAGPVETATVDIQVFAPSGPTAAEIARNVRINSAIQDGLRYLWYSQSARTTFDTNNFTNWGRPSWTALVVLAFENHGYRLPNDNSVPTGIYQKYIVRRGLNTLANQLSPITLTNQPAGSPCAGAAPMAEFTAAGSCVGYYPGGEGIFYAGYATAMMILPFSGSGALNRTNSEGGGPGAGKTYGEITQRLLNAMAFGQNDPALPGRGGWNYGFNGVGHQANVMDGSTAGWNVLAILDAQAAAIPMPSFLISEFGIGLNNSFNTDGSFDYNADPNPNPAVPGTYPTYRNLARGGIGAQGHFLMGGTAAGARGTSIVNFINSRWNGAFQAGDYTGSCGGWGQNKGCAYGMFNVFKGLKLLGVTTLPNVGRPAGPGAILANDWYADYQDWLINNQQSPTSPFNGNWGFAFSCCEGGAAPVTAIAELILSSVALVLPDADKFASVGLQPQMASGVESSPGAPQTHTVIAKAEGPTPSGSPPGTPGPAVPGATVTFNILAGSPNAGLTFTGVTNASGEVSWTYTDSVVPFPSNGSDFIRANIGTLLSNTVEMKWLPLDTDSDGINDVDDNCVYDANPGQEDTDSDGQGDACDADDDGDGVPDTTDNCPLLANSDQTDTDTDGQGDACDADDDNDGVADAGDNCQFVGNTDQANNDLDGQGDACDADDDNDGVADAGDNCQFVGNTDQANTDGDSQGDACDADDDNDGVADGADNCQFAANTNQANNDGDSQGDACDLDDDNDGVADGTDNCQFNANADQANNDGDALGDICDPDDDNDGVMDGADNCHYVSNPDQLDTDADGQGNACDADDDNDTVADAGDNCPLVANSDQTDTDRDGTGNACDATPGLLTGRMNGGGSVFTAAGSRVSHGFALYCNPEDNPQRLEVNWGGNRFHLESVSYSWCGEGGDADPPATNFDDHNGSGTGRYNGQPGATVTWAFSDGGEPGVKDTATITITVNGVVVLHVSGDLRNGNHQAHR